jgi:hypothetical protein
MDLSRALRRTARTALACLAACLALSSLSCRKPRAPLAPLSKDEISGERLWRRISTEADFESYPEWPGYKGVQIGQSPHGRYHEIYINPVLRAALPIADRTAPDGSVIVKENFDADMKKVGFTVMAKAKGYDPATDDWFWASYGPDGSVAAEGKVEMCIKCHEGMKRNDYVIVRALDAPLAGGGK